MKALRRATGLALLLTYAVIVLGAWVRATGSGLSCPDWPTCYGRGCARARSRRVPVTPTTG